MSRKVLLLVGSTVAILVGAVYACKNTKQESVVASSTNESGPEVDIQVNETTGDALIKFPTQSGYQNGMALKLKWDVVRSNSKQFRCSSLRREQNVRLEVQGETSSISTKIDMKLLNPHRPDPQQRLKAHIPDDAFAGMLRVRGCLYDSKGTVVGRADNAPVQFVGQGGFNLQAGSPLTQYAEECAHFNGYIPPFSCTGNGEMVPITVNGQEVRRSVETCDKPIYLNTRGGHCKPFTRIGRLKTYKDREFTQRMGAVHTAFICRKYNDNSTAQDVNFYDVAIIQTNKNTGVTCWFQHLRNQPTERVPPPHETPEQFAAVPVRANCSHEQMQQNQCKPESALPAASFWLTPNATANIGCNGCHDMDPYIHVPWIDQVSYNGRGPMIPEVNRRFGAGENDRLYQHLGKGYGFERWATAYNIVPVAPTQNDPERPEEWPLGANNRCLQCHSISSMGTCYLFGPDSADMAPLGPHGLGFARHKNELARSFPESHWMPRAVPGEQLPNIDTEPDWVAAYSASMNQLNYCCKLINGGPNFFRPGARYGREISAARREEYKAKGCDLIQNSRVVSRADLERDGG